MDRTSWTQTFSRFQARARGYLVRNESRRARKDFEDVVNGTDGATTHLKWVEAVISLPHFTDTDGPLLHPCYTGRKTIDPVLDVSAATWCSLTSEGGEGCVLVAKRNAEKDDSCHCPPSCPLSGPGEKQRQRALGDTGRTVMGSTTGASTTWSPAERHLIYDQPQKASEVQMCRAAGAQSGSEPGPRQHRLANKVPQTVEALRLHRNTLSMEQLWIQQAIDSRKKYLSLKESVS